MPHLDLRLLAGNCRQSDPGDRQEQGNLLTQLLQVRARLEDRGGLLMDAAQALQQFLAQSRAAQGPVDLDEVGAVVTQLVELSQVHSDDQEPPAALPLPRPYSEECAQADDVDADESDSNPYADWSAPSSRAPARPNAANGRPTPFGAPDAFEPESAPQDKSALRLRVNNSKVLGEILVSLGLVTRTQLNDALKLQSRRRIRIGAALVKLGYIGWQEVESAVRVQNKLRQSLALQR